MARFSGTAAFDDLLKQSVRKNGQNSQASDSFPHPSPPPNISPTFNKSWLKGQCYEVLLKRNATFPLPGTKDQLPCEQPCDFHTVHPGNVSCAAGEQSWVHQGYQFPPWPARHENFSIFSTMFWEFLKLKQYGKEYSKRFVSQALSAWLRPC